MEPEARIELLTTVASGRSAPRRPQRPVIMGPELVGRYVESLLASRDGDQKQALCEAKAKKDSPFIDTMLASMRMAVRKPPEIPLGRYLAKFRGFYPPEYGRTVWVVTALYLTRLCALPGFHLFRGNAHYVVLIALTLAVKYLIDNCPHSIYFAHVGGISLEEHKNLEALGLRLLDYKLYFDQMTFYRTLRNLEAFEANREMCPKEKEEDSESGKAVGKKMIEFLKEKMCCLSNHTEVN